MQSKLQSLTYISRAADGLSDEDVYAIYKTAQELNAVDGVTGLLVFDGAVFMQIVEGGEDALNALVTRLEGDTRHHKLDIVDQRVITERSFADWSMKLINVDRAHLRGIDDLDTELGPRVQPDIRAMLLANAARMSDAT